MKRRVDDLGAAGADPIGHDPVEPRLQPVRNSSHAASGKRILILGLNYAPEEVGIARYTSGMARGLARRGRHVSVVAGHPYYPQWRRYPGFGGGWKRSLEQGVEVVRCPHYVPRAPSGAKRLMHLASFALAALPAMLRAALAPRRRPDLVMCIAPALAGMPVAWLAARISAAPLWLHVQDFEVDAAFATGLIERRGIGGLLGPAALRAERRLLRAADRVSTIGPQMIERLVQKGVARERIAEVRNWADGSIAPDPSRGGSFREEWSLGTRKIALYSGTISNKQGINLLVEAAQRLEHRDDIAILICGEGAGREALERAAARCPNLVIKDLQPTERMRELLGLAHVHLLPQLAEAADLVLPSKLANMLASGRPVVATAHAGTGLHEELQGCGLCTPPGDGAALAGAIAELVDDPGRAAELGEQGRLRAAARWSEAEILDRLDVAVAQLLASRQSTPA
jgi:colanic acid biosynthesis glycosyl transferase WcaI